MAAMTNYLENMLADYILRGQAPSIPTTLYIALYTSPVNEDGTGTEVTGAGYARVAFNRSLTTWSGTQGAASVVASNGTTGKSSNNVAFTFPAATAAWPSAVTHWAITTASSGGNVLCFAPLTVPKTVASSDALSFSEDTLSLTFL